MRRHRYRTVLKFRANQENFRITKQEVMKINRRQFVGWMSLSTILTTIIGCNVPGENTSPPETTTDETQQSDTFQVIGTIEELESNGRLTDDSAGVIVIRSASNDLIALSQRCPHQGCAVSLTESGERLACPCHGSEFTIRGELLQGPATTPLPNYEVKTEDNQVLVKVS